jgi:hypothetical protein
LSSLTLLLPPVKTCWPHPRFIDCWLLVASATFLEELLGVGHMAMLGRFRRRIATAAISRCVWGGWRVVCVGGGRQRGSSGVERSAWKGGAHYQELVCVRPPLPKHHVCCSLIIDKALPASVLLERPERLARLAGVMIKVGGGASWIEQAQTRNRGPETQHSLAPTRILLLPLPLLPFLCCCHRRRCCRLLLVLPRCVARWAASPPTWRTLTALTLSEK